MLRPPLMQQLTKDTLIITLLNTRSLRKYSGDILSDTGLLNGDILRLTEIQLNLDQYSSAITSKFQGNFTMYFNANRDRYKSIAVVYSGSMLLRNSTDCNSMSILTFKKPPFFKESVKIALLYRSPNSPQSPFLVNLKSLIDRKRL